MDFRLSDEQRHWQRVARTFATEEVRPLSRTLDQREDPGRTYPVELIRRASELGLRTLKIPVALGGAGASMLTEVIVLEELCAGDVGFGMTLQHAWREGFILAAATTQQQREQFLGEFLADDTYVLSVAITEAHAGSDNSLPFDSDLRAGSRTKAVLDGDEWVIDGSKMFVTNTNVGQMVVLFARTDPTVPWTQGLSCLLVPNDAEGVRLGRVEDKLGIRLNQNAEIIFEDCRVPRHHLLGEVNRGVEIMQRYMMGSKTKEGAKSLGIARAACEAAVSWAQGHQRAGVRLIERQSVSTALADMYAEMEAARALMYRAAWLVDNDPSRAAPFEDMVKILTAETGARIAWAAMGILGVGGALSGNPTEKYLRDAISMLHAGGGNHAVRSRLGRTIDAHEWVRVP